MGSQHSTECAEQLVGARKDYLNYAEKHPEIRDNEPWYMRLALPPIAKPAPIETTTTCQGKGCLSELAPR